MVRDWSGETLGGARPVVGPMGRFGTGLGTVGQIRGILGVVWNGSWDPLRGPGRVGGTPVEVRDGLVYPQGGPERVGGHSGRSGKVR